MTSKFYLLNVYLHGEQIGNLAYLGKDKTIFTFDEKYINDKNRFTLSLRFKDTLGELITDFRTYRIKLMPFFSNLLPEGPLRKYLAEKAGVHPEREFFLLSALGQDLPGAISVYPAELGSPQEIKSENQKLKRLDKQDDSNLRFSLAGVQLKFSAIKDGNQGLKIPASGQGGKWIIKLPSPEYAYLPENEFSMMTLASKIGINVPDIDLVNVMSIKNLPHGFDQIGSKAFIIRRFDRNQLNSNNFDSDKKDSQLHIEDFAQVFNVFPDQKYEKASYRHIASVIASESDHEDIAEFIRRLTFNVLIGNGDMHLKNWSLIYPNKQRAKLAPAYDFVSTIPYIPGDKSALKFSRSKDYFSYDFDELKDLAARAALPQKLVIDTAKDTVELFMEHWKKEKDHLPMDKTIKQVISKHLAKLPITGRKA